MTLVPPIEFENRVTHGDDGTIDPGPLAPQEDVATCDRVNANLEAIKKARKYYADGKFNGASAAYDEALFGAIIIARDDTVPHYARTIARTRVYAMLSPTWYKD